jgi:hypothetical protein
VTVTLVLGALTVTLLTFAETLVLFDFPTIV